MRAAGLLLLTLAPLPLAAQSSQFGVRGFGLPGRELSARAMGTGGGFALFDAESSRNPASIAALSTFTASFAGLQNWRTSTNPAGEATVKTFQRKDGHVWLLPHNDAYDPIPGDNATILGVVTAVLRSL